MKLIIEHKVELYLVWFKIGFDKTDSPHSDKHSHWLTDAFFTIGLLGMVCLTRGNCSNSSSVADSTGERLSCTTVWETTHMYIQSFLNNMFSNWNYTFVKLGKVLFWKYENTCCNIQLSFNKSGWQTPFVGSRVNL